MASKPSINTVQFFNKDDFSDVSIKFGARTVKAHKIILCSQSEYFSKLCGPKSRFAESEQTVIELKDDNEAAVQAMLEWIYTFDYSTAVEKDEEVWFHIHVSMVADKYGLPALKTLAFQRFSKVFATVPPAVLAKIITASREAVLPDDIQEKIERGRDTRLGELLKEPEYQSLMRREPGLTIEVANQVAFAKQLVELRVEVFTNCRHVRVYRGQDIQIQANNANPRCGAYCQSTLRSVYQFWCPPSNVERQMRAFQS